MHIVKDIIYVLMEGNLKRKCIFEYWNYALDDAIFIATRINFNDLNQGNTILHYRNYMYIKFNFCYFLAGAPRTVNFTDVSQSLLEIDGVKEVHDLRMWSLSMNKVAIAVHLAVGLYIVLDLFTFFSLHPLMSSCMTNFCKHWTLFLFRPHDNVELLTFICHPCTFPH